MRSFALTCLLTLFSLPITTFARPAVSTGSKNAGLHKRFQGSWHQGPADDPGSANLDRVTLQQLAMSVAAWFANVGNHLDVGLDPTTHQIEQRASLYLPIMGMYTNSLVQVDVAYEGVRVHDDHPEGLMADNGLPVGINFLNDIAEERRAFSTFTIDGPTPGAGETRPPTFLISYEIQFGVVGPPNAPQLASGDAIKTNVPTPGLQSFIHRLMGFLGDGSGHDDGGLRRE